MPASVRSRPSTRALIGALFALALALRIVVPAGFMPSATANGIVVTICNGVDSARTMVIDLGRADTGKHGAGHENQQGSCAFSALAFPTLAADITPVVAEQAFLMRALALPPPAIFDLAQADHLTPPLRGPPGAV